MNQTEIEKLAEEKPKKEWAVEQIREFCKKNFQSVAARMTKVLLSYYDELLISEGQYKSSVKTLADGFKEHTAAKDKPVQERFLMPTDKQLVEFAILVNEGKLEQEKLADMVAMCELILDRLHEHGNVMQKSSKEKIIEHGTI